jgi:hypothetical protein
MEQQNFKTKWNWGAFALTFPFAVGCKAYLGLLVLVPFLNFVWVFISGAVGEKWALENGEYRDEIEFRKVMDTWSKAGLVTFMVSCAAFVLYFLLFGALFAATIGTLNSF